MLLQTAAIPAAGSAEVPTRVSMPSEDNPSRHHCVLGHFGRKMGNMWCLLPGTGMQSLRKPLESQPPRRPQEGGSAFLALWMLPDPPPYPLACVGAASISSPPHQVFGGIATPEGRLKQPQK